MVIFHRYVSSPEGIPIKNWINNDSYGYGLYTGWWLTYPSEQLRKSVGMMKFPM